MTIRAVYFDFGGVLVRTEYQSPRQHLAEQLGLDYSELVDRVFSGESARQASLGLISEDEHWAAVMHSLHRPESETQSIREAFFAGDVIDLSLLDQIRRLRADRKVGLISNAFSGLRTWIEGKKFSDLFDSMTVSAEVGVMKPEARIYQMALDALGVAPAESVFVDDFPENVEGARAVGMQAIHFTQPEQALDELHTLLSNHH
jgi:epoxide hydrolase-like predicted phosphatase